jgi:hypothetical protein
MNVTERKAFDLMGISEEEQRLMVLALDYYIDSVTENNNMNWAQTITMAGRLKHLLMGTLDER